MARGQALGHVRFSHSFPVPATDMARCQPPGHVYAGRVGFLSVPQPYDFVLSTARFRVFGSDLANAWHEDGLHRVVGGREVRIVAAPGGVAVDPFDDVIEAEVRQLLGLPFELDAFRPFAAADPVLRPLEERLRGFRPVLAPTAWEMLVTAITAQQISLFAAFAIRNRLIERYGERGVHAWSFPSRDSLAAAAEDDLLALGFSRRKAEYVLALSRGGLDLDGLHELPDEAVKARIVAVRGFGEWTADWFLARYLARPRAWPAGDLALRKAVSSFYGDGRPLTTEEVRELAVRFDPFQNLTAHYLLAGLLARNP
jgi:DNA-3-methyladenine glycosylase II